MKEDQEDQHGKDHQLAAYWQGFADIVEEIESLNDEAHAIETLKRVLEIARAGMQGTLEL